MCCFGAYHKTAYPGSAYMPTYVPVCDCDLSDDTYDSGCGLWDDTYDSGCNLSVTYVKDILIAGNVDDDT